MIFSCGDTAETEEQKRNAVIAARAQWHPFFALMPRTIGEKNGKHICAWLQWIERRCVKEPRYIGHYDSGMWTAPEYEYRVKGTA